MLSGQWVREEELVGDASCRRYARLWDGQGRTAVVVRYPRSDRRRLARDLEVRAWCGVRGLRVPALLSREIEGGWAVLEDFGKDDAEQTLAASAPRSRLELALRAVTPLAVLAGIPPADLPPWNAPLDRARMRWELAGFELWFLRHRGGAEPPAIVRYWLDGLAEEIDAHPKRVCHRDFHLNNLFFLRSGEIGLIDFQDVLVGPESYDAVSLLEERGMPRLLRGQDRAGWRESWANTTSALPGWRERWRMVRVQRGLKVLGTFARLAAGGDSSYESWLTELARELAPALEAAAAPAELVHFLLD